MSEPWLRQRERGSVRLLRLMLWLIRRLGTGAGQALLHPIALYYLLAAPGPRAASSAYLGAVLGRPPSWGERYRHLLTFARTIMDRVLLRLGRIDAFELEVRGLPAVDRLLAEGRGFILLGAHFGSFEVLRAFGERGCATPVRMAMFGRNAGRLHGFLRGLDPGSEAAVIPIGEPDSALRIKEALDRGAMVGILGDRSVAGDRTVTVDFLGRPARFPLGPIVLAGVLRVPVVLFFGIHIGVRRYAIEFEPLADRVTLGRGARDADAAAWVRAYARAVEARCRRHPFNWFNFYDFWGEPGPTPGGDARRGGPAGGARLVPGAPGAR